MPELPPVKIRRLIGAEESAKGRFAAKARISRTAAIDLLGMDVPKWMESIGENEDSEVGRERCGKVAQLFFDKGWVAANDPLVSQMIGRLVEVSDDFDTPATPYVQVTEWS